MDGDGVADLGLEGQGLEVRGLWWTCGAWSIMGRYVAFVLLFFQLKGFV